MYVKVLLPLPLNTEFLYSFPHTLGKVEEGFRVLVPFGARKLTGYVISVTDEGTDEYKIRDVIRVIDKEKVFTKELVKLSYSMEKLYLCSAGQALSMMIPSGKRESEISMFSGEELSGKKILELSPDQEKALKILDGAKEGLYYLYGVTGSGKSEVYLRTAERVIKEGKQVIYLVPEITLTHQISKDVMIRFDNKVAILHSALTPSQRLKYWHGIINGEIKLIIGARSGVFAPCNNLGLIILDEEHEGSYKSGNTPRYHARQIAQIRANENKIPFIMGSATPSLEAWHMMKKGLVQRISMPNRVGLGAFPDVRIVNLLKEGSTISKELEKEISLTLSHSRSVLLFLNRRGYNYTFTCTSCGNVISCPNCSVPMTYHKAQNRLVCHYCSNSFPLVHSCPSCNSTSLSVSGFGTEKVEEDVKKLFPSARVARLDTDVSQGDKKKVYTILEDFKNGKVDILLGTQMIAKGLNFPLVELVGVILADSTLNLPDFRSQERTFSLLEQVAGRAGRYAPDGKVLIQTYQVDNKAIIRAKEHELEEFYEDELRVRKELNFPPFSRLINLTFRSRSEELANSSATEFASFISDMIKKHKMEKGVTLLGAAPCIIEKKAGSFRYHVLISGNNSKFLAEFLSRILENFKLKRNVYLEVDVDPLSLL